MEWIIKGKQSLSGEIEVGGAKNAALPILCASILSETPIEINNLPNLLDVKHLLEIIGSLNVSVNWDKDKKKVFLNTQNLSNNSINPNVAGKLRASFLIAGSLLGKFGEVEFPLPGGCSIGQRPIDLHLKAFESLGATWKIEHGKVIIKGPLHSGTIFLDFPSVGATENALLVAVSLKGTTRILNAAEEPEIHDLVGFLRSMGADIEKETGKSWLVHGGKPLKGLSYNIMPDRIEAGTWLLLSAMTDGKVTVKGANIDDLSNLVTKLRESGFEITENPLMAKLVKPLPIAFQTGPHPSFATDLQPQSLVLSTSIPGMHIVVETVFENRFQHVPELIKMGANIKVYDSRIAVVYGGKELTGARVKATDLRAGASLLIAGLFAKGNTILENTYQIERGYEDILHKLEKIGAKIERVEDEEDKKQQFYL